MKKVANIVSSNHIVYFYPFSGFDAEGVNSIVELYNSQFENSGELLTIVLVDNFGRPELSNVEREMGFAGFFNELGLNGYKLSQLHFNDHLTIELSVEDHKLLNKLSPDYGWSDRKVGKLKTFSLTKENSTLSIEVLFAEMDALNVFFELVRNHLLMHIVLKLPGGGLNISGIELFSELIRQKNYQLIRYINVHENNYDMKVNDLVLDKGVIGDFKVFEVKVYNDELAEKIKRINKILDLI